MQKGVDSTFRMMVVPITQLHENKENTRLHFDEGELKKLAESIRQVGLIFPLIVHPSADGSGWEVIDGHRRLRALRLVGYLQVTVLAADRRLSFTEQALIMSDTDAFHLHWSGYDIARRAGMLYAQVHDVNKCAELMRRSVESVRKYLAVARLSQELLEQAEKRHVPFKYMYHLVCFFGRQTLAKHLNLPVDKIIGAMLDKWYMKTIPHDAWSGAHNKAVKWLMNIPPEDGRFWLKDPAKGFEVLEAFAGEKTISAKEAYVSLLRKLPVIKEAIATLRNCAGLEQFTEEQVEKLRIEFKHISREWSLLQKQILYYRDVKPAADDALEA